MSQRQQQEKNEVENPTMRRLRRLTVSVTQESCPLSISTRAIGFMLTKVARYLACMPSYDDDSSDECYRREKIEVPLSAMYRVSLAQLETKVHLATSTKRLLSNPCVRHPSSLYDPQPSSLLYSIMGEIMRPYSRVPCPVSVIINSIGYVETNGMHYEPKFTKKTTPLNLRISNLRKYCEDMANPNTAPEYRKNGYQLNSIPNAEWENEDDLDSVVLKNPDAIIAAGYDKNSFSNDVRKMNEYLMSIPARTKLPFQEKIDYRGSGDPGILASTRVLPEYCWRLDESNNIFSDCEPTFWSREYLTPESWSIGVLTLAGELSNPTDDPHRSQMLAAESSYGDCYCRQPTKMQRRSQGSGRGRRGTMLNRQRPTDEKSIRGMGLLGPLFSTSRQERLFELGGLPEELACPLSVSTRGIGFMISRMVSKIRQQLPEQSDEMPEPAVIYRASLAQLQEKMDNARALPLSFPLQSDAPLYDVWPSSFAVNRPTWILESNNVNVSQIALIINSVGNFEYKSKQFGSVFAKEPSPLNLQITNLRDYCLEMANPDTEAWKRRAGFELNSIPSAIWERRVPDDPKSVVLTNPDDIIPADYNHIALSHDVVKLHKWVNDIGKKIPDLRGEIDYKRDGDPSLLVSSHAVPGRCLRLEMDNLSGDENVFWSRECIDHDAWCLGILSLTGEVLNPMDGGHRSNIGGARCCLSWSSICDMIL